MRLNQNFNYQKLKLITLLTLPIIVLLIPTDYLNDKPTICVSKLVTDEPCPGCGITRATLNLVHFKFKVAWDFNPLVYIVFPIMLMLYIQELRKTFLKVKKLKKNNIYLP
jgi:hypothetical protein